MKRGNILCIICSAALLFGGCGSRQGGVSYIGADQAKQLALDALALLVTDVEAINADLIQYNGQDCYRIDITVGGQNYQYSIDAQTGVIVGSDFSAPITGNSATGGESSGGSSVPTVPDSDVYGNAGGDAAGGNAGAGMADNNTVAGSAEGMITMEDAISAALTHAGLTAEEVTFVKNKLDYEDGRQVYELEFYTSNYGEYDYEIDAYTGEVVGFEYDAEHYAPPQSAEGAAITADEAKELALAKVPGASADDIKEFEADYDHGRTEYEGKIIYDGKKYEFEIDGSNGQFLSWEEKSVLR